MKLLRRALEYQNMLLYFRDAVLETTWVKKFKSNYPRLYTFIADRFSLKKFSGFPLTIFFAAFVANFMLLTEIVEAFQGSAFMLSIDKATAQFLFDIRVDFIACCFFYFSKLGSTPGVMIVALIALVVFVVKRKWIYILALLIAVGGTSVTVILGKNYFHRVRPIDLSYYREVSYSFPSGHATIAIAFYGLLFYCIIRDAQKIRNKFRWLLVAILFVLLLGFSRLYLGVHFVSDVFAGYSLGLLWLLLAVSIVEYVKNKSVNP